MSGKNQRRKIEGMLDKLGEEGAQPLPAATTTSNRMTAAAEVLSGDKIRKVEYRVDPSKTRMWKLHDRDYSHLNAKYCSDLIESFKAQGQQEAAVARRVEDDGSGVEFELIYGARRRWTAEYLNIKLLIEVRELSNIQAFALQDLENRNHKDITTFERARSYYKALVEEPMFSTQQQMAEVIGINTTVLSRFLALARFPELILNAFGDGHQIPFALISKINQLFSVNGEDVKYIGEVETAARKIADEQMHLVEKQEPFIKVGEVLKRLQAAAAVKRAVLPKPRKPRENEKTFARDDGTEVADLKITPRSLTIKINRKAEVTRAEIEKLVLKHLISEGLLK